MKNLLAVILIALCAIVFNSNKSQAQDDAAAYVNIHVSFEGGIGDVNNATVGLYDTDGHLLVQTQLSGYPNGNGYAVWNAQGFAAGTYVAKATFPGRGPGEITFTYSGTGSITRNVSLGAAY
jgi:hypothetical protein